ncbi:hypothetical protein N5853_11055 [Bartonella sp. HY329]|uniref:hypothetical protein n=1 Tax=unclassified Bartonella TaxID=2645622 RepID=UPI0021CA248D|nr:MULTISPECIES: hypothetical protein [unclassified Bartonella]UXM94631.1 hypothetical protein N5853_11055 [Bartonella sp. HY329]UXN08954.1 hypothetical protein N5852_11065 [Bartonella sp. HY328]
MTWRYKIGVLIAVITIAASIGFIYGREHEEEAALKSAVKAYQTANEIQYEVNSYSNYALCLAIGGMPDKCKVFLRRVDKTTSDK